MNQEALDLLTNERVSALSVCLQDGSCHTSTMHFSFQEDPLTVFFQTENTSIKFKKLPTKASVVVGFNEETMQTLQIDGDIQQVSDKSKLEDIHKIHYAKNPAAEQYKNDPGTVFLAFTPAWWRYSDYKAEPHVFIENK